MIYDELRKGRPGREDVPGLEIPGTRCVDQASRVLHELVGAERFPDVADAVRDLQYAVHFAKADGLQNMLGVHTQMLDAAFATLLGNADLNDQNALLARWKAAFQAQRHCRNAIETLKNLELSRKRENERDEKKSQNKLMELMDARMDRRAKEEAGREDKMLETLAEIHRAADERGQKDRSE